MYRQIVQAAKSSLGSLLKNKVRSALTMSGIVIGVSSVMIIMSIGAGAQGLILNEIKSLGSNLLAVMPGASDGDNPFSSFSTFAVTTLRYDDVKALEHSKYAPHIQAVAGYNKGFTVAGWRSQTYNTGLTGVTASYLDVEESKVAKGRFFTEEEEKNLSRVAILGHAVKEELFGESDALGENVEIKSANYEVIGVMAKRGVVMVEDYDDQILLPIKTAQKIMGVNHVGLMRMKIDDAMHMDQTVEDVKQILREQHGIRDSSGASDDFTVRNSVELTNVFTTITDSLRYFLAAMAALSLVVGGIGIMNIMMISVTERTREIGLRKAVGAKNSDIMGQFLLEAIFITGIGGIIGIFFGVVISGLLALGIRFLAEVDWMFIISPLSIMLSIGVSAIIGLFFGYYPAYKASKLDPIISLGYE